MSPKNEVIAVVPARGGSKGIKKKNLQLVGGMPLVGRALKYAKACPEIERVYVSSDSDAILKVGTNMGVFTHKRSKKSCTDDASTEDALFDFISSLQGKLPKFLVYLQCTTPFLNVNDLTKALLHIKKAPQIDTILSGKPTHLFLWRKSKINGMSVGINHDYERQRQRRQDLEFEEMVEDGSFYILRTSTFLKTRNRFGPNSLVWETTLPFTSEIDNREDLNFCKAVASYMDELAEKI